MLGPLLLGDYGRRLVDFGGLGRLGLDAAQFAETIQQHRYVARVDADVADGLKRGIRGSPVVFVNDKRIDGVPSLQALTDLVETELAAKSLNR